MPRRRLAALLLLCSLLPAGSPARAQQPAATPAPTPAPAGAQAQPTPDPNDPVEKIKDEGMNRSQVMQILSHLTDVIGPRLTNSPQMKRANEWTRDKMQSWGMQNAKLEAWGPFGRGWSLKRFSAEVVAPQGFPLIAYPKAWSPGTQGPLTAEVVYLDAKTEADLQKYKGQLRGKIVLTSPAREIKAHFEPEGTRLDEKNLLTLANAPDPAQQRGRRGQFQGTPEQRAAFRLASMRLKFLHDEGAALLVDPGRGDGGTVFVSGAAVPPLEVPPADGPPNPNAPRPPSSYSKDAPPFAPQIVMASEHYNRLVRMLQAGDGRPQSV